MSSLFMNRGMRHDDSYGNPIGQRLTKFVQTSVDKLQSNGRKKMAKIQNKIGFGRHHRRCIIADSSCSNRNNIQSRGDEFDTRLAPSVDLYNTRSISHSHRHDIILNNNAMSNGDDYYADEELSDARNIVLERYADRLSTRYNITNTSNPNGQTPAIWTTRQHYTINDSPQSTTLKSSKGFNSFKQIGRLIFRWIMRPLRHRKMERRLENEQHKDKFGDIQRDRKRRFRFFRRGVADVGTRSQPKDQVENQLEIICCDQNNNNSNNSNNNNIYINSNNQFETSNMDTSQMNQHQLTTSASEINRSQTTYKEQLYNEFYPDQTNYNHKSPYLDYNDNDSEDYTKIANRSYNQETDNQPIQNKTKLPRSKLMNFSQLLREDFDALEEEEKRIGIESAPRNSSRANKRTNYNHNNVSQASSTGACGNPVATTSGQYSSSAKSSSKCSSHYEPLSDTITSSPSSTQTKPTKDINNNDNHKKQTRQDSDISVTSSTSTSSSPTSLDLNSSDLSDVISTAGPSLSLSSLDQENEQPEVMQYHPVHQHHMATTTSKSVVMPMSSGLHKSLTYEHGFNNNNHIYNQRIVTQQQPRLSLQLQDAALHRHHYNPQQPNDLNSWSPIDDDRLLCNNLNRYQNQHLCKKHQLFRSANQLSFASRATTQCLNDVEMIDTQIGLDEKQRRRLSLASTLDTRNEYENMTQPNSVMTQGTSIMDQWPMNCERLEHHHHHQQDYHLHQAEVPWHHNPNHNRWSEQSSIGPATTLHNIDPQYSTSCSSNHNSVGATTSAAPRQIISSKTSYDFRSMQLNQDDVMQSSDMNRSIWIDLSSNQPGSQQTQSHTRVISDAVIDRTKNKHRRASGPPSGIQPPKPPKLMVNNHAIDRHHYHHHHQKKSPIKYKLISNQILFERIILQASTSELLQCLGEFMKQRCKHLHNFHSKIIIRWLESVDRHLIAQGWQEISFINPANIVFVYLILRKTVHQDYFSSLYELQYLVMSSLYLSYAYMGNEISYPLKPFVINLDNMLQFWNLNMDIINRLSGDMLKINAEPTFFAEMFFDLKRYQNVLIELENGIQIERAIGDIISKNKQPSAMDEPIGAKSSESCRNALSSLNTNGIVSGPYQNQHQRKKFKKAVGQHLHQNAQSDMGSTSNYDQHQAQLYDDCQPFVETISSANISNGNNGISDASRYNQ